MKPGASKVWIQPAAHFTESNQQNVREKSAVVRLQYTSEKRSKSFNALTGVRHSASSLAV